MIIKEKDVTLMLGDCLEMMKKIPDGSIDLVLGDPPFGTTQSEWDVIIPLPAMWKELERIIKPNGAILLFAQTPFDKILGCSNLQMLRYEWIWEKTSATGHLNSKKSPMKAHENILVFYKAQPTYNPQKTGGHVKKESTANRSATQSQCYGAQRGKTTYSSTERYPRDVVIFAKDTQKSKLHPNQKPVALLEYLIKTYSNVGESVLDFSMGSGSTGEACVNTNRAFIGIELDENYFSIACGRIYDEMQ